MFLLGGNAQLSTFDTMRDANKDMDVIFMFLKIFWSIFTYNLFLFDLPIKSYYHNSFYDLKLEKGKSF
jgi:hypothetical protein